MPEKSSALPSVHSDRKGGREGGREKGTASLEEPTERQCLVLQVSFQVPLQPETARTRRAVRSTGGVEHCLTLLTPAGGLKLKGEDDVIGVADLANEASLGAKVTAVHVAG